MAYQEWWLLTDEKIFDQNKIAHSFNESFMDIGPKLASSIHSSSKDFKDFLSYASTSLDE